jgi:regulator of sirC expression with transglutaminase-like and TPR domain
MSLLDDPDEVVFDSVKSRILGFGMSIVSNLEHCWENTNSELVRERIESLIHQISFNELLGEFDRWLEDEHPQLLSGSMIVAKYHHPNLDVNVIFQKIEKLRRNIWLELNSYLTPIEQMHVFNSVFFHFNRQQSLDLTYDQPDAFLINKVLENRQGNILGNATLYLILCQLLDIPVSPVFLPNHVLLGYPQHLHQADDDKLSDTFAFFIDPQNGQLYSYQDVFRFLKKTAPDFDPNSLKLENNKAFIQLLLEELSKCFDNPTNAYKQDELLYMAKRMKS